MKCTTPNLIVSAKVIELQNHPQASKLKIATVFDGNRRYQVICGAQNLRKSMVSLFAKQGAQLPNGLKIEPTQIRGEDSAGMLCSPLELGISEEKGIIDLPPEMKIGLSLSQIAVHQLSSTPWYSYQKVESFWQTENQRIEVLRGGRLNETPQGAHLISETYYHQGQYYLRRF